MQPWPVCCRDSVRRLRAAEEAAGRDPGVRGHHRAQRAEGRRQAPTTGRLLPASVLMKPAAPARLPTPDCIILTPVRTSDELPRLLKEPETEDGATE